ncbi:hypothetical protein OOJ91_13760 [Micromonospora lupini]|uniref:hypothetical protein n=1 Tax=Micromonospora lupini TaxID=285679 RepID=UPI002255FC56|nr:hypothetical protein [Micromonospora lupini]MCX5066913.1 hypothetical protein [Micromonospora lupini]
MKIHLPALGPDLPVHPFTGLTAIGLRRNGHPIWPVKGGSGEGDDAGAGDGDDDAGDEDGGGGDDQDGDGNADDLRDAGKKALDTMKGQRNTARAALRPWTALARELGVRSPDEVKALIAGKKTGGDGGDQVDPEQIRREARAEAQRETLNDRVLDKIEAKARKFADPADAAALLLREHGLDDFLDGTRIDADAVEEALDELLERKPYLAAKAAEGGSTRRPRPDHSQGNRGGAKPSASDRAAKRLERLGVRKPSTT